MAYIKLQIFQSNKIPYDSMSSGTGTPKF